MRKISRRELGTMAAALTAAPSAKLRAQAPESTYNGPLTGVSGLEGRQFDPVAHTLDRYAAASRRLRFPNRVFR